MSTESYWAVAQTVSTMEHLVRREIEKTNHGAFLPTYAKHWKVDGVQYTKEYPLIGGYVFFKTEADDWAGIPDIHGVYDVLANPDRSPKRVTDDEMTRLMIGHAGGSHNIELHPRYTKYFRGERSATGQFGRQKGRRRRPRPGRKLRDAMRSSSVA